MFSKSELQFDYPESLIATEARTQSRVMWVPARESEAPEEIDLQELVNRIPAGDLLVLNNTKVLRRRVFAGENQDVEILFLKNLGSTDWEVLFPAKNFKLGSTIQLPDRVSAELIQKGRPQRLRLSENVPEAYFEKNGELPLPPYIQAARKQRHNRGEDKSEYQTAWAKEAGSLAAPTASLHFKKEHLDQLRAKGVIVAELTLHVGLGTFLPVTSENLEEHIMHFESVSLPKSLVRDIESAKNQGRKVWALGTTVARSLESFARGMLQEKPESFEGETDLFIYPGRDFLLVDRLLTNFHQPESTLLALVAAFTSLARVKNCYRWAIEREFQLFSYGDLSVWIRPDPIRK